MDFMMKVLAFVFLISFAVFVIFFGRLPALRKTPIGALHRLLWIHLPRKLISLDQQMTNGKLHAWSSKFIKHMLNDRHPTILIAFILLLFIPELMFLPKVVPTLSMPMQAMVAVIVLYPYLFLFLAAYVDPGYVSKARLDFYGSLYPYDHTLYLPNQICVTCRLPKPPRSKHCSVCGYCVARLDHHCVFINGCVGHGNQHCFLLLLFSTAILTSTGAWLGGLYSSHLITSTFPAFNLRGSGLSWSGYFSFWTWAMQKEPRVGSIAFLCLLTTPLVWGLLVYSLYLVYRGMTTNESGKWSDFQLDIGDGFVYRRQLPENRQLDTRSEPDVVGWPKRSSHIYIRAYDEPPSVTGELPGEGPWHRDFTLANVENIYDIGFVGNMFDIMFPRKYLMAYTGSTEKFPD